MGPGGEHRAQLVTELVVPSLDETLAFLTALGFRLTRRSGGFAVLMWDDAYLFVAEDLKARVEARWTNVRVIVGDVDRKWAAAASLGARVVNPIGDRSYGLRDFTIAGPGNIEIRFAEVLGEATAAR